MKDEFVNGSCIDIDISGMNYEDAVAFLKSSEHTHASEILELVEHHHKLKTERERKLRKMSLEDFDSRMAAIRDELIGGNSEIYYGVMERDIVPAGCVRGCVSWKAGTDKTATFVIREVI